MPEDRSYYRKWIANIVFECALPAWDCTCRSVHDAIDGAQRDKGRHCAWGA